MWGGHKLGLTLPESLADKQDPSGSSEFLGGKQVKGHVLNFLAAKQVEARTLTCLLARKRSHAVQSFFIGKQSVGGLLDDLKRAGPKLLTHPD